MRPQLTGLVELTHERFARLERRVGLSLGERLRASLSAVNGASSDLNCVCATGRYEEVDGHFFFESFLDLGDAEAYAERYEYYRDVLAAPGWALLIAECEEGSVYLDLRDLSVLIWSAIEGDFAYSLHDGIGIYRLPSLDEFLARFHAHDDGA